MRVTKPGGTIIVLTPFAECLPYRAGKKPRNSSAPGCTVWSAQPLLSRIHLSDAEYRLSRRAKIGFLDSLDFLDFIRDSQTVKHWLTMWYHGLPEQEKRNVPGYLLVSVGMVGPLPETAENQWNQPFIISNRLKRNCPAPKRSSPLSC